MRTKLALLTTLLLLAIAAPASAASLSIDQPNPSLGDTVTFTHNEPKQVKHPRIAVRCYQDTTLVYAEANSADSGFLLGGAASDWLRAGGPTDCTAELFYFRNGGQVQRVVTLATTQFSALG